MVYLNHNAASMLVIIISCDLRKKNIHTPNYMHKNHKRIYYNMQVHCLILTLLHFYTLFFKMILVQDCP